MSAMAQSGGERDEDNYCFGMAGSSKNYRAICKQYLCDFYILQSGIPVLGWPYEEVLESFLKG